MMFPKPRPRVFEKQDIKREMAALERAVRAAVNERDERRCRCCGRNERLHLHHLTFRSKGGQWSTENLVTLDDRCHAMLHARQLWIFGKNADTRLTFDVHESAVVDLFGTRTLPAHVRIVTDRRR
jgi:hypothetical protein